MHKCLKKPTVMYVNYLAPVTDQKKTCGVGGHPTRSEVNLNQSKSASPATQRFGSTSWWIGSTDGRANLQGTIGSTPRYRGDTLIKVPIPSKMLAASHQSRWNMVQPPPVLPLPSRGRSSLTRSFQRGSSIQVWPQHLGLFQGATAGTPTVQL